MFSLSPASVLSAILLATSAQAACSCGYRLAQYSNSYFRNAIIADFTTTSLSGTATSSNWLSQYGFWIADGYQVGAVSRQSDATVPLGSYKNVRINNHLLELVVPGGQKITNGGSTSNAQIEGPSGIVNGVFTMRAKIDDEKGTCQAIFTYHDQDTGTQDEQDIEILGSYLYNTGSNGTPPGIELTNYDPTDPNNERNDYRIVPFTADPAAGFHNYTIAWLPGSTKYYMDSTALNSPTKYFSVNPSAFIVNHWTNGDSGFTQGPPTNTAVSKARLLFLPVARNRKSVENDGPQHNSVSLYNDTCDIDQFHGIKHVV